MRASAIGVIGSWVAVAALMLLWPGSPAIAATVLAIVFTTLLVAHIVAFLVRAAAMWHAQPLAQEVQTDAALSRRRFIVAAASGLGAVFIAPVLGRFASGLSSVAEAQQPAQCELVLQTGARGAPPYIWVCRGECPPLYLDDANETEVTGTCTLVRKANPNGEPAGPKECFCVYEPPGATCAIQRGRNGQFTCVGDCPDLFTAKRGVRGRRRANKQCVRVEAPVAGGYEVKCICVYS
jgi:hypothetical protein